MQSSSFTIADGDRYEAMPGGLARVSPEPGRWLITLRSGGVSKDTWVIAGMVRQETLEGFR